MNLTRIRVGCSITALIGVMYAAVGLFDSLTHVAVGAIIASAGVIGYGLADWLDMRREEETRRGRAATWARRDAEARWAAGAYYIDSRRDDEVA